MTRSSFLLTVAGIILLAMCGAPAAEVFKWRDADGKLHYSDRAPPDASAETVDIHTAQDKLTAQRLKNMQREAAQLGGPTEADAKAAAARELEKQKRAHCDEARQKLNALLTSTRRQVVDENGQRRFLDEEERQAQMREIEAEIASVCR